MTSKFLIPAIFVGALPLAAVAEVPELQEFGLARDAAVSLQSAGETALNTHPGKLAAVIFGDEDGRLAWEAIVVGQDGEPWSVLIDAKDGQVFASAAASSKYEDDQDDHEDGETDDD